MERNRLAKNPKAPREKPVLIPTDKRLSGAEEVCQGFTWEQAHTEALRCLSCRHPTCVDACPLHIDIKSFIEAVGRGEIAQAHQIITENNPFPAICGRVCQHEYFCEKACLLGIKREPVAIGLLERFVADHHRPSETGPPHGLPTPTGPKVALAGSGPASLMAAAELARKGYRISVFEALHKPGGVLAYGIPPFRLPRNLMREEVQRLRQAGVEFFTNFLVGRTATLKDLFAEGYDAVFLGAGAGLPYLLNIPGENLLGIYTANEYLTRLNLMHAEGFPKQDTPVLVGKHTLVVGGGNAAMDAARWARRLGSETTVVFRRSRAELRARAEEVQMAEQEGVRFDFLAVPVRFLGDERGHVQQAECIRMQLGEPDASGRPAPIPLAGSEYRLPAETVVVAIGQGPNPTLQRATPQLLTREGRVVADEWARTNLPNVFAGGDVVRGGSTIVLAMCDGHTAAEAIDRALKGSADTVGKGLPPGTEARR